MIHQHPFKWRHFEAAIILLCVRWYLKYALSYRDVEEMMLERGSPSITQRSIAGSKTMPPSSTNDADHISKPATTRGKWMKRTSKSRKPGGISTVPSIPKAIPWSFS